MIQSIRSLYRNAGRRVVVLFALVCSVVALGGCATDSRTMKLLLENLASYNQLVALHEQQKKDLK